MTLTSHWVSCGVLGWASCWTKKKKNSFLLLRWQSSCAFCLGMKGHLFLLRSVIDVFQYGGIWLPVIGNWLLKSVPASVLVEIFFIHFYTIIAFVSCFHCQYNCGNRTYFNIKCNLGSSHSNLKSKVEIEKNQEKQ